MSPDRLSKGARAHIRKLKGNIRASVDLSINPQESWAMMEEELKAKIPNFAQISADGRYSIIYDWYETRHGIRYLAPLEQREKISEFQKKHSREDLVIVKDALAMITQTLGR